LLPKQPPLLLQQNLKLKAPLLKPSLLPKSILSQVSPQIQLQDVEFTLPFSYFLFIFYLSR